MSFMHAFLVAVPPGVLRHLSKRTGAITTATAHPR
jgi:hypothetical protein